MDEPDARTRLREAALDLFGRQGVAATSTREILAAAGMRNPSAISYHFGSKAAAGRRTGVRALPGTRAPDAPASGRAR